MTTEEKEYIYKVKRTKEKIIWLDSTINDYKDKMTKLENKTINETNNRFKMLKTFGLGSIVCLIITAIIGEPILILPALLPLGIGLPITISCLIIDKSSLNLAKKENEKIIADYQIEKNAQVAELRNLLVKIKKNTKQASQEEFTESENDNVKIQEEQMITSLISELVEARKKGNLNEVLINKYKISDPEIISLCSAIVDEELNLQIAIKQAEYIISKEYKK